MQILKKHNGLLRRHKYVLVCLILYWPLIFVLTHTPVPQFVDKMGMSDKTMHFCAYLVLVTLFWLAVSPYKKIDWKKPAVWIVLAILVWYGAMDEWLQGFVNRNPDVGDFKADFAGTLTGLIILTLFGFWGSLLSLTTIIILIGTNFTSRHIILENELLNTAFYLLSYSILTIIWLQITKLKANTKLPVIKWWLTAISTPACILTVITVYTLTKHKQIWPYNLAAAVTGIILPAVITFVLFRIKKRISPALSSDNTADHQ